MTTTHRSCLSLMVLLVCLVACRTSASPTLLSTAPMQALPLPQDDTSFVRATAPIPLSFPADHGAHPDYQTEWWYYTGNLTSTDGQRFGYQLTFFRRALLPAKARVSRSSEWAAEQVYMAHFAITAVDAGKFYAFERFARGAGGVAGATSSPSYHVWLEDWQVQQVSPGVVALQAAQDDLRLQLTLTDVKGVVLQGDRGYSRKGQDPGNASFYYSQPRQASSGTLAIASKTYSVQGLSWMDHEFSTSALSAEQIGWDWFSMQLDDGSELMLFQLRRADGSIDAFSSGSYVAPDGTVTVLQPQDFTLTAQGSWQSPHTQARYPAAWQVTVPTLGITLQVKPLLADQELRVSFTYWEGAVALSGQRTQDGSVSPLNGFGYLEMTGYAQSMAGEF